MNLTNQLFLGAPFLPPFEVEIQLDRIQQLFLELNLKNLGIDFKRHL